MEPYYEGQAAKRIKDLEAEIEVRKIDADASFQNQIIEGLKEELGLAEKQVRAAFKAGYERGRKPHYHSKPTDEDIEAHLGMGCAPLPDTVRWSVAEEFFDWISK